MSVLAEYIEPFWDWVPWECETFSKDDVINLPGGMECDAPYDDPRVRDNVVGDTAYHIARVAYLFRYWESEEEFDAEHRPTFSPSSVHNGVHPLLDGNHRYAAALVRGDKLFMLDVDGDIDEAEAMFGMTSEISV